MTYADPLLWLWAVIFLGPTIVAVAPGRPLRWWAFWNLAAGWHPIGWLVLLMLAGDGHDDGLESCGDIGAGRGGGRAHISGGFPTLRSLSAGSRIQSQFAGASLSRLCSASNGRMRPACY